jgi:hypothetical protein
MENFCRRSRNRSRSRSPDRSRAQRGEAGAAAATVKFRSRWTVDSNRSPVAQMKNEEVAVVRIVGVVRVVRLVRVVSVVGVVSPPCPSLRALGCWSRASQSKLPGYGATTADSWSSGRPSYPGTTTRRMPGNYAQVCVGGACLFLLRSSSSSSSSSSSLSIG